MGNPVRSLFGGGSRQQSQSRSFLPEFQERAFERAATDATSALDAAQATGPFQGQTFAGLGGLQNTAVNQAGGFGLGAGANLANQAAGAASGALGAGANFGANAARLEQELRSDPTLGILAQAQQFAQGPQADALVDASTRDIARVLGEQQLPALERSAIASGNTGSSRAGIAEGILRRGAADRVADVGAGIRQSLIDQGVNTGLNAFNTTTQGRLGANEQIGRRFGLGLDAVGTAQGAAAGNFGLTAGAGGLVQADRQAALNDAFNTFNRNRFDAFDVLDRFNSAVGSPIVLNESSSQSTGAGTGILGQIGGGLAGFKNLGGLEGIRELF